MMAITHGQRQRICATLEPRQVALLERVAEERSCSVAAVLRCAVDAWAKRVPTVSPARQEEA